MWFANPYLALVMYLCLAVSILLLPWSHIDYSQGRGKQLLPYHVLGGALLNSLLAVVLTRYNKAAYATAELWRTLISVC